MATEDDVDFDTDVPPPYLCWQMGAEAEAATAKSRHRRYRCFWADWPMLRGERDDCSECGLPVDDAGWHTPIADDDCRCHRKVYADGWWVGNGPGQHDGECVLPEGHDGECAHR